MGILMITKEIEVYISEFDDDEILAAARDRELITLEDFDDEQIYQEAEHRNLLVEIESFADKDIFYEARKRGYAVGALKHIKSALLCKNYQEALHIVEKALVGTSNYEE